MRPLLAYVVEINRKLNYLIFPRSRVRYVDRFREVVAGLSQSTKLVLHLGSGPKDLAAWVPAGCPRPRVINVDISPQVLRKNPGELKVCADAELLPLPDECIDAIYCEHVFEHLPSPGRVLQECVRILRGAGHLVVSGPNGGSYVALAARLTPTWFHGKVHRLINFGSSHQGDLCPTFYRFNSPRTMRRLARGSGLAVVSIERFVHEPSYTTFLPGLHILFIAYHLVLQELSPWFGFHMTSVAVFQKPG